METCFEDLFSLYRSTIHNQWPSGVQGAASENSDTVSYQLRCGPAMHDGGQASSPERQQQPSAAVEDEEARQGPLSDDSAGAPPASNEVRATVSIFSEPVQRDDGNMSTYPSQQMSADFDSNVTAPQGNASFQQSAAHHVTQPYAFPSTSSFNPYGEHSSHTAYGFSMQPQPTSKTVENNVSSDSPDCEQPTDLSMPKGNQDVNHTDSDDDDSDDDDDTPIQPSNHGQSASSVRYPTYTHLSDVSNDSEDGAGGNKQPTASYTNTPRAPYASPPTAPYINRPTAPYTNVRPGNNFVPPLPHFGFLFERQPIVTNERLSAVSLGQMAEYIFKLMNQTIAPATLSSLLSEWQARLKETYPELRKGKVVIRELDDSDGDQQSGIRHHENDNGGRNANEGCEVIDLTDDDGANGANNAQQNTQERDEQSPGPQEQQQKHNTIAQPHIEKMQPQEPLAMFSLPEKSPTLGAESFTPVVQPSPTPTQEFVLPTQLNEADMPSAASSEDPTGATPSQSPMKRSSPQPSFLLSTTVQNCTTEEPAEHQPVTPVPSAEPFSVLPAEQSSFSQDHPMEQQHILFSASVPEESPPMETMPETSQSLVAFPSCQSPIQVADEEDIASCETRRREPWDHRGLVRFVARNAFTLPRHVWIQRKEGQPRRSMRIAKKKQLKTYFLRERLSSKSASDKRNG